MERQMIESQTLAQQHDALCMGSLCAPPDQPRKISRERSSLPPAPPARSMSKTLVSHGRSVEPAAGDYSD